MNVKFIYSIVRDNELLASFQVRESATDAAKLITKAKGNIPAATEFEKPYANVWVANVNGIEFHMAADTGGVSECGYPYDAVPTWSTAKPKISANVDLSDIL